MLLLRYLGALLRHYEEGFWLVILALINSIPGVRQLVGQLESNWSPRDPTGPSI